MKKKLSVCYRIYPRISKVPPIFRDDKIKLSELCFKSFVDSLKNIDAKIWVLLDNCPDEYNKLFEKYLKRFQYELITLPQYGNAKTFGMQMDILLNQNFSEIIYFAEDDYFYLESALPEMIDLILDKKADFCTPYDHSDSYNLRLHNYKNDIILNECRHWRTVATTTMTFMTTKKNLKEKWNNFNSYTKSNYDSSLWLSITKFNLRNPIKIILDSIHDLKYLKIYGKAFLFLPIESIFGKRMKLMSPMPTLATHMESDFLPQYIDWNKEFEKLIDLK